MPCARGTPRVRMDMRFIEIELDGKSVRALVNEAVPVTANAIWEALPFEGRAVHAQIAICLGEARFRGHAGVVPCTPLAQIEGDFSEWATGAHKLDQTGARPIKF